MPTPMRPGHPPGYEFETGMDAGGRAVVGTMLAWWGALAYYQATTASIDPFELVMLALAALPLGVTMGIAVTLIRLLIRAVAKATAGLLLWALGMSLPDEVS